ncbi:MAG: glycosyltransferase family 39 protein [Desulfobulbaceae bacterium]|nr:glycosyltransferase family 39 protein [Desulfobulbaceae bacterium]
MSVSSEWNSLKAAWIILLLALGARIFLSNQFLLTPDEALYWQAEHITSFTGSDHSHVLSWLIHTSTAIFGNNEIAVRLPAILSFTLASFYMILLGASMFSWHSALHVALLSQGILQFNMAALIISPYSLVLTCWSAVCYHSSQAMHSNRTGDWLFAGFWFGLGLLCNFSMILLLPFIILCFILIKPFRTCLLYPGPWFSFLLSLTIYAGIIFWVGDKFSTNLINDFKIKDLVHNITPDMSYSLQFIIDQAVLVTPLVFLLILTAWFTGTTSRHMVKADAYFLTITSFPLFLLFLIFPVFSSTGIAWSAPVYITALVLIAGIHSSTRSSFKGRPKRRWILSCIVAYLVTIPLLLQIAYPVLPLPLNISQTKLMHTGWDLLGKEIDQSLQQMPDQSNTFVFSLEPGITAELAFYTPGSPQTVPLDHMTRTQHKDVLENQFQLTGKDGIGLVRTREAIERVKLLFDRVELERELRLQSPDKGSSSAPQSFYIIRCFHFTSSRS